MIENNQKTSLLVQAQLPEYVQDNPEYANFRLFLKAYYEWMEQNGNVTERSKNLLSYKDIDRTTDEFLDYFTNEFLPYFPKETLISKQQAVKVAKQLYQTKGTPASYQFLFRILFDSDFDYFNTKEAVLRASDGIWYVAKSLKLSSSDPNLLNIANYRLFGETTKSIATIETSVLAGTKTEVFISNIERLFESGEFVRVVDNNNQDVLFGGQPLRAKIVGQISQIRINPKNRGLLYQPGDPVVVYDGLSSNTGLGATAEVGSTTAGSIQRINVLTGGYGYTAYPNTLIDITKAPGANAIIGSLNPASANIANVGYFPIDSIALKKDIILSNSNYFFTNAVSANINTKLSDAFTFKSFTTYPISSVLVINGGGGITEVPEVSAKSYYPSDNENRAALVSSLGMLGPIQIVNRGYAYQANDVIVFTGGSGIGARANVLTVNATGAIMTVGYVPRDQKDYPLGGIGYKTTDLPSLSVTSQHGGGAELYVPNILGEGASFSPIVDRAGSVTTINVTEPGEDYISSPNVSLRVQDIVVANVSLYNLPTKGDVLYQGVDLENATYIATVDSVTLLSPDDDPDLSIYNLRVFNYNSNPVPTLPLVIDKGIYLVMNNTKYNSNYNDNGVRNYGDGTAKANATFLNGLVISQGQYLNSRGQPSSFDVLQNEVYNNFTYQITVEKEIEKYRSVLLNLLHPTGMNVIGRFALKANATLNMDGFEALNQGYPLSYFTGVDISTATMVANFTNKSNNIIKLDNLNGNVPSDFVDIGNTYIEIIPTNGPNVHSEIVAVNDTTGEVTIDSNVWLTFGNVAVVTANSGQNTLVVQSLTGTYSTENNGVYSNTAYPLMDIVYIGDTIKVATNTQRVVTDIDFENNIITVDSNFGSSINSYMSVNRTFVANSSTNSDQIRLYNPVGSQY